MRQIRPRVLLLCMASAAVCLQLSFYWKAAPSTLTPKEEEEHLPWMVIFPGPIKTASTSMQQALTFLSRNGVLDEDNYVYLGRFILPKKGNAWTPLVESLLPQTRTNRCGEMNATECFNTFVQPELDNLWKESKNVLIYDEWLHGAGVGWKHFAAACEGRFRVAMVIGYRRMWHWLPSRKNEWEKKILANKKWPERQLTLLEKTSLPYGIPKEDRRPVPSPPFFAAAALAENDIPHFGTLGTLQCLQQQWPGAEVCILDYHTEDVVSHFLCDILPEANSSCAASAAASAAAKENSNPSRTVNYHFVAVEAADQNLLDKRKVNIEDAARAIQKCSTQLRHPLPMECLDTETAETLFEKSAEWERIIVANFSSTSPYLSRLMSQSAKDRHRSSFWNSTHKFCSPNITEILADPFWLSCFKRIGA